MIYDTWNVTGRCSIGFIIVIVFSSDQLLHCYLTL